MARSIKLIVYPVKDIVAAKTLYDAFLGIQPYVEGDYYIGYKPSDDLEVGLDPNGQDVIAYVDVEDVESSLKELLSAGATVHQEPKDVGGGILIAQVKDANGSVLGLRQAAK